MYMYITQCIHVHAYMWIRKIYTLQMRYREQQSYQRCQKGEQDVSEEVARRLSGTAAPAPWMLIISLFFSRILFLFLPPIIIVTFAERLKLIDTTLLKCYIKVRDTEGIYTCLSVLCCIAMLFV